MNSARLILSLACFFLCSIARAEDPPKSKQLEQLDFPKLTPAAVLALAELEDDRTKMIPELKAMYPNAKVYKVSVTFNSSENGAMEAPEMEVTEKWVNGKWIISEFEMTGFPGDDKRMIMAVTYHKETATFLKYVRVPNVDETAIMIGKGFKRERQIDWQGPNMKGTEKHTDTETTWTETITEDGKVSHTTKGKAVKVE